MAAERYRDHDNTIKENIELELAYSTEVQSIIMEGSMADIVLEESRIPHSDLQATERKHQAWLEHLKLQSPLPGTHFLQRGYTYSNKDMPSNIATPYEAVCGRGDFLFKPPCCEIGQFVPGHTL